MQSLSLYLLSKMKIQIMYKYTETAQIVITLLTLTTFKSIINAQNIENKSSLQI
jgi:hypothetical protein